MSLPLTRVMTALALVAAMPAQSIWNRSLAQEPRAERPVVVELFTSQGCSSCPPADAILGELASNGDVIALGFHVDYWDGIGWRDRYSMPEATQRQRRYVDALGLSSAFTPQIVVDGRRSLVGSDRHRIAGAIAESAAAPQVDAVVVKDQLVISLPSGDERAHDDVVVIAYLPQSTTRIGGGENSGRALTDFNIVRQIRRLGMWDGKASTFRAALTSLPSDASHVAVLIQQADQGPIVGATALRLR